MRRGWKFRGGWFEARWGRVMFYGGICKPYLALAISLGPQNYLTIGPFTVGIDFE